MAATLPELDALNRFFWTGGADGRLRILRCDSCGHWMHPPGPACPKCLGRQLSPQVVSGLGEVEAVTINHQAWTPGLAVPYAIARVTLDGVDGVRLTTRIVGMDPEAVAIGMLVKVRFEACEDVFLPFFEQA